MAERPLEFANRTVTVMGLGTFGGGLGAVRFFAERGAKVIVTDLRSAADLGESLVQFDPAWPVTLRLGEHLESDFTKTDIVVVSPAVPKESLYPELARDEGIPVTTEMNLFWERNRGRVIAVTGSNGKSTTTAMISSMLNNTMNRAGRTCWLGGNIGISLLPEVEKIAAEDVVVLELSSFQLEDLAPLRPKPEVAVVTNFSPNHLDRHGSVAAYREAKQVLLRSQTSESFAVVNAESEVAHWPTAATRLRFGLRDDKTFGVFGQRPKVVARLPANRGGEHRLDLSGCFRLPGSHNWQNAQAAIAAALAAGATIEDVRSGLSQFTGLPHRLQFVEEVNLRRFVNDSKSTTPEATVLALQSFDEPIVLLAGGYDKQIDLGPIASAVVSRCRAVALLGQTGSQLAELIEVAARSANFAGPICRCFDSLRPAVLWSYETSQPGDVVLLSPGCASYDWFRNYIERGEAFSAAVRSLRDDNSQHRM